MGKKLSKTRAEAIRNFVHVVKQYCPDIDGQYDLDELAHDYINKKSMDVGEYNVAIPEQHTTSECVLPLMKRIINFFLLR